jgi:hypothetical protein
MSAADVRKRLIAFYKKYNPDRLPDVDRILYSYRDNEEQLFAEVVHKYAPLRCVTRSLVVHRGLQLSKLK